MNYFFCVVETVDKLQIEPFQNYHFLPFSCLVKTLSFETEKGEEMRVFHFLPVALVLLLHEFYYSPQGDSYPLFASVDRPI